tara:strand:+ start:46 stop:1791 length:1746 start_codon:yes stop_codon:yes gene_type:complete
MSVFNRQLFNGGGEVLEVRQTGSQLNPEEFTFFLEYRDGKPVAVRKQTQGIIEKEDVVIPINTNLSASGDPKEAFDVMRRNQLISTGLNTALGIGSLFAAPEIGGYMAATRFGKAVPSFLGRAGDFLARNLSPVRKGVPYSFTGPVKDIPGFYFNPRGLAGIGIPGVYAGGQAAITTPEEVAEVREEKIAEELAALEASQSPTSKTGITGRTSYEAAIKSAIESGDKDQVRILRDKMKELYGEDSPLAEEFLNKPKQPAENIEADKDTSTPEETNQLQPEQERPAEPTEEKEVPLLQNKNFLDLMRNIGIKMVETGDLGRGISLGSAEALKEGRAERLLEEQRQAELDKIFTEYGLDRRNSLDVARAEAIYEANLAGSAPPDVSDIKNINQLEQDYIASMQSSQNKKYTAKQVEDVIQVLKSSAGQVFGVNNIIQSNFKKIMDFIAGDPTLRGSASDISEGLKSENPREYIKTILEIVQNKNIKELLGESGRTISNLDRQVVEKIVGQLKDTSVLSQSPKAIATKLQLLYDNLIREAQQDEDKARINANNLTLLGRDPATLITSLEPQEQRRERIKASDYT